MFLFVREWIALEELKLDTDASKVVPTIGTGTSGQPLIKVLDLNIGKKITVRIDQQSVSEDVAQIAIQVNGPVAGKSTIAQCAATAGVSGQVNIDNLILSLKHANGLPLD